MSIVNCCGGPLQTPFCPFCGNENMDFDPLDSLRKYLQQQKELTQHDSLPWRRWEKWITHVGYAIDLKDRSERN